MTRQPSAVRRGTDGLLEYVDQAGSVTDILHSAVTAAPDREAVVVPDGPRLTYRELLERSRSVAAGLHTQGLAQGDRVGIDLPNGVEWVVAFWAGHLAGCVVVPLNSRLTPTEKAAQVADAGCALVLDDPARLPRADPSALPDLPADPRAIAEIFYTSGTTGRPKGVAMSHRNLWTAVENTRHMMAEAMGDPDGHRSLISVPLFHTTGCHSQLLATTHMVGTSVIMASFDVEAFLQILGDEQINQAISVPTIYWRAAHHPAAATARTDSVTAALFGGAPVPPELAPMLRRLFPHAALVNGFGCTESTGVLTALPDRFALTHTGAVGLPMPTVEIELRDPDASGAGEMFARGASMMAGYWNGTGVDRTGDAWVSTGDIARQDADGVYWIVDRAKDVISRGGEKIYCVEVENVMIGVPGAFEVALVAVPDPELGERAGLVVSVEPSTLVEPGAVAEFAAANLPAFKRPELLHVTSDPLPRNASGKILKGQLRDSVTWTPVPRA